MSTPAELKRQADTAANYGMANYDGDIEVAEELGITFDPDTRDAQYAAGQEVASLLNKYAEVEPPAHYQPITDGSDRWSPGHWRDRSPAQKLTNHRGIAAVRNALISHKSA